MSDQRTVGPYNPSIPENVPVRPVNVGMVRDRSTEELPTGAHLIIDGYLCDPSGLKKAGAFDLLGALSAVPAIDRPLQDLVSFWQPDGDRLTLLIGRKFLWLVDYVTGLSRVAGFDYTPATQCTLDGTAHTFTDAAETFTSKTLYPGDVVILDPSGTPEYHEITALTDTEGTFVDDTALADGDYDYTIVRSFHNDVAQYRVTYDFVDQKILFADRSPYRGLLAYDGTNFGLLNDTPTVDVTEINTLLVYDDRVWIFGMTEDNVRYPYRVRWTTKSDRTDFPVAQYSDLPYTDSEPLRAKDAGSLIIIYCGKKIFYGRPTNIVGQPFYFVPMDTGDNGLVGQKALCSYLDGHFFIGQDDIYFFSAAQGTPQRIGSAVADVMLANKKTLETAYAVPDPTHSQVVFGIPGATGQIETLWFYNYKTKGWSFKHTAATFVSSIPIATRITFDNIDTVFASDPTFDGSFADRTIDSARTSVSAANVHIGSEGLIYRYNPDADTDAQFGVEAVEVMSGDMDFGYPDYMKTVSRLKVKISRRLNEDEDLRFQLYLSYNRGRTWKRTKRDIRISAGTDEGKMTFKATGSLFRYRLRSVNQIRTYTIDMIGLRVRIRGVESAHPA